MTFAVVAQMQLYIKQIISQKISFDNLSDLVSCTFFRRICKHIKTSILSWRKTKTLKIPIISSQTRTNKTMFYINQKNIKFQKIYMKSKQINILMAFLAIIVDLITKQLISVLPVHVGNFANKSMVIKISAGHSKSIFFSFFISQLLTC